MIRLYENGAYLLRGEMVVADNQEGQQIIKQQTGAAPDRESARQETIAYRILKAHNTSDNMQALQIKFVGSCKPVACILSA